MKSENNVKRKNKIIATVEALNINLMPAIIFTSIIIFIMRLSIQDNTLKEFWWNQYGDQLTDFFSYYKMFAVLVVTGISLTILAYKFLKKKLYIKPTKVYMAMIIYSICVIISFTLSDYKEFSLFGWPDRYEGTLVLLGYMVMLFYIINSVNNESDVKWMVCSVMIACSILGLVGLSQGVGQDIFATDFGKKMIIPQEYWQYLDNLSFRFNDNEIYQTVYNINYVSFYLTLIVPLVGILFLTCTSKRSKVLYALIFTLLMYNLFGASSSGGVLGISISSMIAIVIFGKKLFAKKQEILILSIITVLIVVIHLNVIAPELRNSFQSAFGMETTPQTYEISIEKSTNMKSDVKKPSLEFIETNKDSVVMSLNNEVIKFVISKDNGTLKIYDGDNNPLVIRTLNLDEGDQSFAVEDERFEFITMDFASDGTNNYLLVNIPEITWTFMIGEKTMLYRTSYGSLVDLRKVESFGFKGNEGFGSGRGYIWSRSLPLIKDTLIWGHGADTYTAYFPQDDFAGKYTGPSFSRDINTIIRKPHNMYLGTAINTGMVSLIALLSIFVVYLVQSFKIYRKNNYKEFQSKAGVGIFLGISGFLTTGLVYDSNVCIMPLFYGLLGIGIAINHNIINVQNVD